MTPTHDMSIQLWNAAGPARHEYFRGLIVQSGKQCRWITSAISTGGLDGTDEWIVKCVDSGTWDIWFSTGRATEVRRCLSKSCN